MYVTADQHCVFYERNGLMDGVKSYVLRIIAAAIICAVVRGLLNEKTTTGQVANLLCGIFMAVTVIAPLANISFQNITCYLDDISVSADAYVEDGKTLAQDSISEIIITKTNAYILDKAKSMGLQIEVEVELDADNNTVPCGITIHGAVSPYAREELGAYIEENLGIAKEFQKWT